MKIMSGVGVGLVMILGLSFFTFNGSSLLQIAQASDVKPEVIVYFHPQ